MPDAAFTLDSSSKETKLIHMGRAGVSVSTEDFFKAWADDIAPDSGLLPPVVRWVSTSRRIWLFERPPTHITISHHNLKPNRITEASAQASYDLPLPWTAYLVELDAMYYPEHIFVYALGNSISSAGDIIGILPLANFYSTGKLCPPPREGFDKGPKNVGEGLALAYQMVWSSGFNLDLATGPAWCIGQRRPKAIFSQIPGVDGGSISPAMIMSAWSKLSLEEVTRIPDWMYPMNFSRDITAEIGQSMASISARYPGNTQTPLYQALDAANQLDFERRPEWGARSLLMSLSGAVSLASMRKK